MSLWFKIIGLFGALLAVVAGLWLDQMPVLDQTILFIMFQVISLLGVVAATLWWFARKDVTWLNKIAIIIAAFVAWRVAYFPVMVFAGWIATLGEQLQLMIFTDAGDNFSGGIIYPVFLLAMYFMHAIAVWAAGAVATLRQKRYLVAILPVFVVAVLVSFSTASDLTFLPDHQIKIDQPLPVVKLPVSNPYLPALQREEYSISQRVFIFSAGSIYALIPNSPWSKAVKGTIEEEFRQQPNSSTNNRILEHYLAYHAAHSRIKCVLACS